jgi:SPOR domain
MSPRPSAPLTAREKVLIGGLGALTPLAANLFVVDFASLQTAAFAPQALLGYLVKASLLFSLGGFIAYLHDDERKRFKLFQLGLGVPALAVALLNGRNVKIPQTASVEGIGTIFGHTAFAQEVTNDKGFKKFALQAPTGAQAFWQGVTGRPSETIWFVVAGSHLKPEDAKAQASQLRSKGLAADVYLPYAENKYYAVVVGGNLTRQDAESLRRKVISLGAPKDTYLWTFPKK